jgi:hypothetical protein
MTDEAVSVEPGWVVDVDSAGSGGEGEPLAELAPGQAVWLRPE